MTAADKRAKAEQAGYTVWPSNWEASDGETGISWVITKPNGDNLEDYEGSEAVGWRAAYRDLQNNHVSA